MSRSVVVDRWDLPELDRALAISEFAAQRKVLAAEFSPWGADALDDIFFLLYKARPELTERDEIRGSHVVGYVLVSLLSRNAVVKRLRASTMRDVAGAALAAAKLAPFVILTAGQVAPELGALSDAETQADNEPEEDWLSDLAETRAEVLADAASEAVESGMEKLESTAEAAAEREEEFARQAMTFGVEGGGLQRLSVPERLELARRLDTPEVRQITELFGRLRNSMWAERAEIEGVGVEPYDVEFGSDVTRLVGSELLAMEIPGLFEARLGDAALALYAMRGEDRAGRGGIVLCVDASGSMRAPHQGYTRELWASALKLFLLQTALREDRAMHVIDFGGESELQYHRFVDGSERTPLQVLEAASTWYGYGTNFNQPLRKAVEILAHEGDRDCDVVFVSDGECQVGPRVLERYRRATKSRRVRTWGVQVGRSPGGLPAFCDRVIKITDLTSGRELGELLNAVEHH